MTVGEPYSHSLMSTPPAHSRGIRAAGVITVSAFERQPTLSKGCRRSSRPVTELFGAEAQHATRRFGQFTVRITRADAHPAVPGDVIVLTRGDIGAGEGVACRVASACVMSTALDSADCDCREQLDAAMQHIAQVERGVILYLTHQEGRGHGLKTKVRALANKNRGFDTFAAVRQLGLESDVRSYDAVPPILDALGVRSVVLLGNSRPKMEQLIDAGMQVIDVVNLHVEPSIRCQTSMLAKRNDGHAVIGRYADAPLVPYP